MAWRGAVQLVIVRKTARIRSLRPDRIPVPASAAKGSRRVQRSRPVRAATLRVVVKTGRRWWSKSAAIRLPELDSALDPELGRALRAVQTIPVAVRVAAQSRYLYRSA